MARKAKDNSAGKETLYDWILGEINFFEGFDYGDTALIMAPSTQNQFRHEMAETETGITLNSIPVIVDKRMKYGAVQLTTRFNAEMEGLLP